MSNSETTNAASPDPSVTQGRMTLMLIAGIPVIVILASTWLWYFVMSGELDLVGALGTSNNGKLVLPPRQAEKAGWESAENVPFSPSIPARWTLVVPLAGKSCGRPCESLLYQARQIHQSLGKEIGRVQRLFVTDGLLSEVTLDLAELSDQRPLPASFSAYLASEQRGMGAMQTPPESFKSMFSELEEFPQSWYLMDPSGWLMMRYDSSVNYKDVISDLKFLIKNSNG
ncbi:MAG: hypothetical protein AAF098_01460 [Pseudomonadota bacterium]